MIQIGILLAVLGFGSLILEQMDMEFRILSWAYDMQPVFGIVLGIIGLALIGAGVMMNQKKNKATSTGTWSGDGQMAGSSPSAPQTSGPQTGGQPAWGQPATGATAQPYGQNQNPLQAPGTPTYGGPAPAPAPGQPAPGQHGAPQGQPYGQPSQQGFGPQGGADEPMQRPQQSPGFGQQPNQQPPSNQPPRS